MADTITVLARLRAKKGLESRLRQELQSLLDPTRAETGCISYDLHESGEEPGLFLFYENWKSQADLDTTSRKLEYLYSTYRFSSWN